MTQLTLKCLKYIKGMFNRNVLWHSVFLIPWQLFYGKKGKNAILTILLKYREIDVQIQTVTEKIETSFILYLLVGMVLTADL